MSDNVNKRVLIAPLNWGLGHATRCIPVIQAFLNEGHTVLIGAEKQAAVILKEAFPDLEHIFFPGFQVEYPTSGLFAFSMIKQGPAFLKSMREEHELLDQIVEKHKIDLVVSDNRYGCWSSVVPSVLITHQLTVKTPFAIADWLTNKTVSTAVKQFTACWIPDLEGEESLSGKLSQQYSPPAHTAFIGPLSRFSAPLPDYDPMWNDLLNEGPFNHVIMVSGPEPMADQFRKKLKDQALNMKLDGLLITGNPERELKLSKKQDLWEVNHLPASVLGRIFKDCKLVIARSGYSTIMDLAVFGMPALLIPTPGQTEQEYLAKRLAASNQVFTTSQRKLWLPDDLEKARASQGIKAEFNSEYLIRAIKVLT